MGPAHFDLNVPTLTGTTVHIIPDEDTKRVCRWLRFELESMFLGVVRMSSRVTVVLSSVLVMLEPAQFLCWSDGVTTEAVCFTVKARIEVA